LISQTALLHDIALIHQCRLLDGRKQFLAKLTAVASFLLPDLQFCSFSQHSALQSFLFLQSTFLSPVCSVPPVKIPLSIPLCYSSQHSALQSALFLQSTLSSPVHSVTPVNIPLSSPLCPSSQHSPLQSAPLCHIKPMTLSVPHSYKHRPSSLHQSHTVTSPTFHCEGLWSTPSRFMYEPWCSNSSTNCLQRTDRNFTSHYYIYVFLLSAAADPLHKLYGIVIVPLFRLTYCYTVSTIHKYKLYQSNYKHLCALNIHSVSLNITINIAITTEQSAVSVAILCDVTW